MADVITRLKVESTEYDSKIKRASQGLLQMEQACRKVGGTLAILEKDELEFVKGLGKMETVSKDARGQLSELTKAFTDLSLQYKRLTDEEKQGDFGKALASSLGELKTRIQDTKGQLSEINEKINGGGGLKGALDQLAGKFGMNIQQLAGWGAAIGAAKVALDVAKDAFFASEATVDEWGRVMDSSKSLYEGFLTALNTGDISGYLSRIDEIVSAARTAYNELDRLGTMKTIQAPQKSAQQTENDRIRQMIQTGHYIAPLDGRKPAPGMKDGQLLTPEQIRTLERQLQNGMKTVVGLVGNEVKQTGKAIDEVYERQAKELGMSLSEFRKGTSSWSEFEKRMNEAKDYQEFEAKRRQARALASSGHNLTPEQSAILNAANPNQRGAKWATFRVDGDRYNELVQLILQRDQQAAQAYGMQSQAYRAINRAEGITTRSLLGGGSGGGKTGGGSSTTTVAKELSPLQQAQKEISALTEEALTADEARRKVIKEEIADLQKQVEAYKQIQDYVTGKGTAAQVSEAKVNKPLTVDEMRAKAQADLEAQNTAVDSSIFSAILKDSVKSGVDVGNLLDSANLEIQAGIDVPDETWQGILDKYNELKAAIGEEPIQIDFNTGKIATDGKKAEDTWKNAASAVQSVGQAFNQIEDPAAKVAGTLAQAIASVTLGYAQATTQAAKMGPWAWVAFAATGLAQMISTISTIKSVAHFAEGGIVGGNDYTDNTPIMVSSGELILNRAQQGNLASQLQEGNAGRAAGLPFVNGQNIFLGTNNYLKGSGQGQLVTTQMLRSKGINI